MSLHIGRCIYALHASNCFTTCQPPALVSFDWAIRSSRNGTGSVCWIHGIIQDWRELKDEGHDMEAKYRTDCWKSRALFSSQRDREVETDSSLSQGLKVRKQDEHSSCSTVTMNINKYLYLWSSRQMPSAGRIHSTALEGFPGLKITVKSSQSSLLYCQYCHMYSTYIQRIEIATLANSQTLGAYS